METTQPSGNPVPSGPGETGAAAPGRSPLPRRGAPAPGPAGRTSGPARSSGQPPPAAESGEARPRIQVEGPADVLAAVPHLFGFHPQRSFVLLGAAGPRQEVKLSFRYDLPDPPNAAETADIAEHAVAVLANWRISTVIGIGYGPGRLVTPVADALAAQARRHRLRVQELLRADHGRYWSYLCRNPDCCPADGRPFDYSTQAVAAEMTAAGLAAYPDRQTRAQALAPLRGAAAQAMDEAIERACARAQVLVDRARRAGGGNPMRLAIKHGRRAVREVIGLYQDGGQLADDDKFAVVAVSLVHLAVRDDAWARMAPDHRAAHLRLWADVVRRVSGPWLPAPASLLAFTAWQDGDGTLANLALDRALAADPGYSMALLLRDILAAGVPPSKARLPMTPEQVAASYSRSQRRRRRSG